MIFTRRASRGIAPDGLTDMNRPRTRPGTVWLINQYANSTDLPGITRHVELAQQLNSLGWRTRIIASGFHHNTASYRRPVRPWRPAIHDVCDDVEFSWLYSTPYRSNGWRRYLNMLTFTISLVAVGARGEKPDVIVGSSPHLLTGLGAWLLARRYRVPFVFEVRDMWPDMLVQLGLESKAVIGPLTVLEKFLYRRAERVVALTDGIKARIIAKGVSPEKIDVIPNGTLRPDPLCPAVRERKRRELGWQGRVVVVWPGSHNPMNGLDVVVEAARHLRERQDILFAFIGDGSLKSQLIEQAIDLPNVHFHDPLPKAEITKWIRAADIGLLHSRRFEVFNGARPNKLFDYMAAGLPVVSTVPGEAWQLIEDVQAGVAAEWENPAALAAAISALADDPALRKAMGARAYRAVCEVHTREATAARLSGMLAAVCGDVRREDASARISRGSETRDIAISHVQAGASSLERIAPGERDVRAAD